MWAAQTRKNTHRQGFTIVELLIVIVVIAILTAIVTVAYNNMQARASFSRYQTDMKSLVKALVLYKADNGNYPSTSGQSGCSNNWCGWDQATGNDFINGLAPQYISKTPQMPTNLAREDSFLYRSDGTDYQLIRYRSQALGGLPPAEMHNNSLLATTEGYNGLAWGYKTNSGGWW
ncbi:MAG TPA: prepilin-type N-terminal cleavage/methylation domain-containing protein [Candidatus Saccharimonadales bacterium]